MSEKIIKKFRHFFNRPRKQGTNSVVRQLCMGGCEDRTSVRKAEESPMLEAIAREELVKTQQVGKGLAGAVVICGD
jgi:hypothetical protein